MLALHSREISVTFVVDKVALVQVFVQSFCFSHASHHLTDTPFSPAATPEV
jgi:hypothetical protein